MKSFEFSRTFFLMEKLFQFYRLLNLLSLDIAAGAVVGALFFAKIFNVHMLPYGQASLGLTVWVIYTTDHLLDARNLKRLASTERHRFHQRNFNALTIALVLAIIIDVILIFFIWKPLFMGGLVLSAIVASYFFIQRYLQLTKEFFGALLYSGGVLLAPLSLTLQVLTAPYLVLIIQFFFIALINLLLFSCFDREADQQDGHRSFANAAGEEALIKTIILLVSAVISISVYLILRHPEFKDPTLILFLMTIVLVSILVFRKQFTEGDRYRLLGDAVFFLPLFYLLI